MLKIMQQSKGKWISIFVEALTVIIYLFYLYFIYKEAGPFTCGLMLALIVELKLAKYRIDKHSNILKYIMLKQLHDMGHEESILRKMQEIKKNFTERSDLN